MTNGCRRRNVDRVLNEERRVLLIKLKLTQASIREWVKLVRQESFETIRDLDSNKANNTPEPSTSIVISNEDDSSVGDGTKDSKVRVNPWMMMVLMDC